MGKGNYGNAVAFEFQTSCCIIVLRSLAGFGIRLAALMRERYSSFRHIILAGRKGGGKPCGVNGMDLIVISPVSFELCLRIATYSVNNEILCHALGLEASYMIVMLQLCPRTMPTSRHCESQVHTVPKCRVDSKYDLRHFRANL